LELGIDDDVLGLLRVVSHNEQSATVIVERRPFVVDLH